MRPNTPKNDTTSSARKIDGARSIGPAGAPASGWRPCGTRILARVAVAALLSAFGTAFVPSAMHAAASAPPAASCENVLAPLELKGAGVREFTMLIFSADVYAVYLYGPPDVPFTELPDAKDDSAAAIIEILHDELPDEMPDELRDLLGPALNEQEMARVREAYRSLDANDRVTIAYKPGDGTRLAINGAAIVHARGRALMANLLDLWLGPNAVSEQLRRRLLSQKIPRDLVRIRRAHVCSEPTTAEPIVG